MRRRFVNKRAQRNSVSSDIAVGVRQERAAGIANSPAVTGVGNVAGRAKWFRGSIAIFPYQYGDHDVVGGANYEGPVVFPISQRRRDLKHVPFAARQEQVLEVFLVERSFHLIGRHAQLDEVTKAPEFLGVGTAAGSPFNHAFVACQIDRDHQNKCTCHNPEQDEEYVLVFKHDEPLFARFNAARQIVP